MKKGLLLLLAALMLAVMLTACAATQPYDGYSNVSTTRNGYVNGTNHGGSGRSGVTYTPGTGTQDPYRTTAPGMTGTANGAMR